jgi:hypothetical protein
MKLRNLVEMLYISERKLLEYALNPANERGHHKAIIFKQKLGYTAHNYTFLMQKIQEMALDAQAIIRNSDQFGQRVGTNLLISGPQGQTALVRVGWLIPPQSREALMVTLWVLEEKA